MCSAQHYVPQWMITSTGGLRLHRSIKDVAQVRAQVNTARIWAAYRRKLESCQLRIRELSLLGLALIIMQDFPLL